MLTFLAYGHYPTLGMLYIQTKCCVLALLENRVFKTKPFCNTLPFKMMLRVDEHSSQFSWALDLDLWFCFFFFSQSASNLSVSLYIFPLILTLKLICSITARFPEAILPDLQQYVSFCGNTLLSSTLVHLSLSSIHSGCVDAIAHSSMLVHTKYFGHHVLCKENP